MIHQNIEKGKMKYYLHSNLKFDSIPELIEYYRQYPMKTEYMSQVLTIAVPKIVSKDIIFYNCFDVSSTSPLFLIFPILIHKDAYEARPWFSNVSSKEAEDMLKSVSLEGAFLVHPSEDGNKALAISLRCMRDKMMFLHVCIIICVYGIPTIP